MDSQETTPKKSPTAPKGRQGTCQVCGKQGAVVFDPEKAPPNRLCYRCAMEYGMQEQDDR
ncbi:MAG: hypothetical protein QM765_14895 [Myxococcales bacterium]